MMAVTATLKGGVLKVKGTKHADTVNFAQVNGSIIIAGCGAWSANQVNSIVIDLKKGNDTVSLNSIANGGWEALAEDTTIRAAKNQNDLVHLATGHDVLLNGSPKSLVVTPSGAVSLNGQVLTWNDSTPPPSTNWFDTHVIDSALRTLGHNLYTDGLIDRNDMISLLRNAEDDSLAKIFQVGCAVWSAS